MSAIFINFLDRSKGLAGRMDCAMPGVMPGIHVTTPKLTAFHSDDD